MKTIFSLALCFSLFCQSLIGQTVELVEQYNVSDINAIMNGLGIPSSIITLQYDVDFYRINYKTLHPNGDSVDVSGALCLPSNLECPLPLSSYQHGTVAQKTNVPSYGNTESQLGLLYASSGYAIAMADYIGLGDSPGLHLYVHAESEAQASLDLLRTVRDLQESLSFTLDGQLFLWGYSQGGHATMALHRKIELEYPEEFTVSVAAPMSGPYDISGEQSAVITSGESYPTPGYLPYVVLSYQEVYGNLYEELEDVFLPEYAAMMPTLFNGEQSMGYINSQLPSVPSEVILPEVLEAYESDPMHPIRLALADNDVYDWAPMSKTILYYCEGDDQVGYMNSIVAEQVMNGNGAPDVTLVDGGDLDHGDCAPFAMLSGFFAFETERIDSFDPIVNAQVSGNTSIDQPNGSIDVFVQNADSLWTYEWADGTQGTSLEGLTAGDYEITVSDNNGCSTTVSFEVDQSVGINTLESSTVLFLDPKLDALIYNGEPTKIVVFDYQGRPVLDKVVGQNGSVSLASLVSGVYIANDGKGQILKFIKE